MLITCPTCAAVYRIDDGAIGPNGRNVQCDGCGAQWRQTPAEKQAAVEPDSDIAAAPERDFKVADAAEDERAGDRPRTPGLEEAAELLQEMREESARSDSIDIFSGGEAAAKPAPKAAADDDGVKSQRRIKSTIASADKRSPNAAEPKGGGFRVGFILALMFIAALAFAYVANDLLAEQFPGAASILNGYAGAVDMIRGGVESAAESAMQDDAPASQ